MKGGFKIQSIIFLGTKRSGSSRDALKAAIQLGYHTCLFTNNSKQINERITYPDVGLMLACDLDNIEKIRESIIHLQNKSYIICAIVSFVDPYCGVAAQLSKEFGVENFSSEAIYIMQNKLKSREALKHTDYNPMYNIINANNFGKNDHKIKFPVVLKYIESNGSKDVYFCENLDSYKKYVNKLFSEYPTGTALVEEYLNGPQYIVEVLVINEKVFIIAIISQEINVYNDHFIITGYSLFLNYTQDFYNQLYEDVKTIIKKHQLKNGPCHLEVKYVNNRLKLIEINPRISGAGMNQMLLIGLGINLVEETLNLALKKHVNLKPRCTKNTFAEYIVLTEEGVLQKITGRNQVLNSTGVHYVFVKPRKFSRLTTPVSLGGRYAYVIATGDSENNAKINAKQAAAKIIFHLQLPN